VSEPHRITQIRSATRWRRTSEFSHLTVAGQAHWMATHSLLIVIAALFTPTTAVRWPLAAHVSRRSQSLAVPTPDAGRSDYPGAHRAVSIRGGTVPAAVGVPSATVRVGAGLGRAAAGLSLSRTAPWHASPKPPPAVRRDTGGGSSKRSDGGRPVTAGREERCTLQVER
jgi:hypothetical protein